MIYFSVVVIGSFLYNILKYRYSLYMLQQNSYNTSNRYIRWIIRNFLDSFLVIDLLMIILLLLNNYIDKIFLMIMMFIFYLVLFYYYLMRKKREQQKKIFVITNRIKRLISTIIIIYLIIMTLILINFNDNQLLIYNGIIFMMGYLSYVVVYLVNMINYPIERMVYHYYKRMAIKKLNEMNGLIKIGVTGSYGKTTVKNIINDILNYKFNSITTDMSLNTPYGLMMTINNKLSKLDEVFVAEMGACKRDDIRELCRLVNPNYGVITKIGLQHLETFKSLENIIKTKFELMDGLSRNGVIILNRDDKNQREYDIRKDIKVIWIGIENDADIRASNIKISNKGMSFEVVLNKKRITFETKLLGRLNIYNLLCGIALGHILGISNKDLVQAVKRIRPVEHRLEMIEVSNITYIDDSFNANPEGVMMALEVLEMMDGKKIIVTPGMIDLGVRESELNKKFGYAIATVCDEVILIGEKQTKDIKEGLLEKHYKLEKIHILNDVREAFPLVKKLSNQKTYVLLENDLPDIFNEGK